MSDVDGIIPVSPTTKHPLLKEWPLRATDNLTMLAGWWRKWPDAMIGLATGKKSGLWGLDIDGATGSDSLAALTAVHGELPDTVRYRTPGGYRYCFRWPPGVRLASRARDIAPGIDVRGCRADGTATGQIIVPPSIRADGGKYTWDGREGLWGAADAPLWLLFLAIFNRRERRALAALGVTGHEAFQGLPPADWHAHGRALLRPAKDNPGARAGGELLTEREAGALERYVRSGVTDECAKLARTTEARQTQIGNAALSIISLLMGAADMGLETGALEEWAYGQWETAREALGDGEHTAEAPEDRWARCEAVAEARDLEQPLERALARVTDPGEEFEPANLPWSAPGPAVPPGAPPLAPTPAAVNAFVPIDLTKDPATLPQRPWLIEDDILRRSLTAITAPPGIGKSALTVSVSVGVADGDLAFLGMKLRAGGPYNVLLIANEDDCEELQKRIAATCQLNGIDRASLQGRIHVWAPEDAAPFLAMIRDAKAQKLIASPELAALEAYVVKHKVDLVIYDPFAEMHEGQENSNSDLIAVLKPLRAIARRTNSAGILVHHDRKRVAGLDDSSDADSARGGSAFRGIVRRGFSLRNPSNKACEQLGIPEHEQRKWATFGSSKASYSDHGAGRWYFLHGVKIANGETAVALRLDQPGGTAKPAKPKEEPTSVKALRAAIEAARAIGPTVDNPFDQNAPGVAVKTVRGEYMKLAQAGSDKAKDKQWERVTGERLPKDIAKMDSDGAEYLLTGAPITVEDTFAKAADGGDGDD